MNNPIKLLGLLAALVIAAPAVSFSPLSADLAFARHGADDPAGDDRGGKGGKHDGIGHTSLEQYGSMLIARHGADDRPGDDNHRSRRGGKGRGGHDDGPNHA
jgi:hypothetical protein